MPCQVVHAHSHATRRLLPATAGKFNGGFNTGGGFNSGSGAWPQTRISEVSVQPGQLPIIVEVSGALMYVVQC